MANRFQKKTPNIIKSKKEITYYRSQANVDYEDVVVLPIE